jgi:hypothetical protein
MCRDHSFIALTQLQGYLFTYIHRDFATLFTGVQGLHLHCFNTDGGVFIYVLTLGFQHIIQQEGQRVQLHCFNTATGGLIQYLHEDFTSFLIRMCKDHSFMLYYSCICFNLGISPHFPVKGQALKLHCFNTVAGLFIQHLHRDFATLFWDRSFIALTQLQG